MSMIVVLKTEMKGKFRNRKLRRQGPALVA